MEPRPELLDRIEGIDVRRLRLPVSSAYDDLLSGFPSLQAYVIPLGRFPQQTLI
jgi:hypothetical protein